MSKYKQTGGPIEGDYESIVNPLDIIITERGDQYVSLEASNSLVSNEGFSGPIVDDIRLEFNSLSSEIDAIAQEAQITLNTAQKEAGAIVAMASKDPMAYHNAAISSEGGEFDRDVIEAQLNNNGDYGFIDVRESPALESFDERDLKSTIAASAVYNIASAKQDEFAEAFYPTTVITPDQVGLSMKVRYTVVHSEVRHSLSGEETDFDKKNLIDAFVDHKILESKCTKVVPYLAPDDSNKQYFVDQALLAPRMVDLDGVSIPTSALATGAVMDILGLSQAPGVLNGDVMDSTDSLDSRLSLSQVYLKVSNDTVTKLIAFNVNNLARSAFNKSIEGKSNEMELNFRTSAFSLRNSTTDISGTPVMSAFGDLGNYQIQFSNVITGTANLETGALGVFSANMSVSDVWDKTGATKLSPTDPAFVAACAGVTFEVVGYDIDAYRTNTNLRTRGLLLDTTSFSEGYKVRLGAPISVPAPVNSAGRTGVDTKALIAAVRTRTCGNAITALLNFISRMKVYGTAIDANEPPPAVEGIGRFLVKPTYRERTIDLLKVVDSERSSDKAEDIRASLVETIRHEIFHMIVDSNYQIAINFDTGNADTMPKVIIGTDPILERYIIEFGDERTLANGINDFKIVTTHDKRMKNMIVMAFTRDGREADPLSFGTHVYMPELTTTIQVTRNGSTVKENQVQPRDLHVNNLPIIGVIKVENLEQIINDKIALKVVSEK